MSGVSAAARQSARALLNAQIDAFTKSTKQPKPLNVIYSTQPDWPLRKKISGSSKGKEEKESTSSLTQIDVGVLDSSFNPPQLAHYALARSKKPSFKDEQVVENATRESYDALLLIFSIKNADKGMGTKKDASLLDRLLMMQEFAKDVEEETQANVAVAIVEEPLMIAKSTLIHEYFSSSSKEEPAATAAIAAPPSLRLHWLVGFDTLQRFFQVKYYPSPDFFHQACDKFFNKERTTFVCARRGAESLPNRDQKSNAKSQQEEERELLESEEVKPWLDQGVVVMIDLDRSVHNVSSTAIRNVLAQEKSKVAQQSKLQQMTTKRVTEYLIQESVYEGEEGES